MMKSSFFSKKPLPDPELTRLREELLQAHGELSLAYNSFDQAVDPELVESCVYQISAVKARFPDALPVQGKEDALWM